MKTRREFLKQTPMIMLGGTIITAEFLQGCSWFQNLNPADLTDNKAQANFANNTYLSAWNDYQYYASLPNLTPDAKILLNGKRQVLAALIQVPVVGISGPLVRFNSLVAGGELITDADWNQMLDNLMDLETGWYTEASNYSPNAVSTFTIHPAPNKDQTRVDAIRARLIQPVQKRAIWEGLLIELIRTGIHAIRAMLAQRGLDEAQMAAAWDASWQQVQSLNVNQLVVIQ